MKKLLLVGFGLVSFLFLGHGQAHASPIVSGNSATISLPGNGSYSVLAIGTYFTCIDSSTSMLINGGSAEVHPGANADGLSADQAGCDQNTIMMRRTLSAGNHTLSIVNPNSSQHRFSWVAVKQNDPDIVLGQGATMNLPNGNYTVLTMATYFTRVDVATTLRLNGGVIRNYAGALGAPFIGGTINNPDQAGTDQNTIFGRVTNLSGGSHTWSLNTGILHKHAWIAIKNTNPYGLRSGFNSMNLPGSGSYRVTAWGSYFTCEDFLTDLKLDGSNVASHSGAGNDSEGCDQNTIMTNRNVNARSSAYTWDIAKRNSSQGPTSREDVLWFAYNDSDGDGLIDSADNNDFSAIGTPAINVPTEGQIFNTSVVTMSGTADANTQVDILLSGSQVVANVPVDGNGNWATSFNFQTSGTKVITARAGAGGANTNVISPPRTFVIDLDADGDGLEDADDNDPNTPIATPTIIFPGEGNEFLVGTVITFNGTGEANTEVDLILDGTEIAANVPVDGNGNWAIARDPGVPGGKQLTVRAGFNGNNSTVNSSARNFVVNDTDLDGDGLGDTTVDNDPTTPIATPVINAPTEGQLFISTSVVTVNGTGEANTQVDILLAGTEIIANIPVDGNGNWATTFDFAPDGTKVITARAGVNDANSNRISPNRTFIIGINADEDGDGLENSVDNDPFTPIGTPVITLPTEGQVLTTNTTNISGTGEANTEIDLIINGIEVASNVPVDGNGDWTATNVNITPDGAKAATARAGFNNNNSTVISSVRNFVLDTSLNDDDGDGLPNGDDNDPNTPIATPIITAPTEAQVFDNANVTVNGTGDPNTQIDLLLSDGTNLIQIVENVSVDGSGNWVTTFNFAPDGAKSIAARAGNNDANANVFSTIRNFVIDTSNVDDDGDGLPNSGDNDPNTPIATPIITFPTQGLVLNKSVTSFIGTGEPNTEVDLILNGTEVFPNVGVDSQGNWEISINIEPEGQKTLIARAGFQGNNSNVQSLPRNFSLDKSASDGGDDDKGGSGGGSGGGTGGSGKAGFRFSGMSRDGFIGTNGFQTQADVEAYLQRLNEGIAGGVKTYVNRNGYEVFAGYISGKLGVDAYEKRFQNKVAFRGYRQHKIRKSDGSLVYLEELRATKEDVQPQRDYSAGFLSYGVPRNQDVQCRTPDSGYLRVVFGKTLTQDLIDNAKLCFAGYLADEKNVGEYRSWGKSRPFAYENFSDQYWKMQELYRYYEDAPQKQRKSIFDPEETGYKGGMFATIQRAKDYHANKVDTFVRTKVEPYTADNRPEKPIDPKTFIQNKPLNKIGIETTNEISFRFSPVTE